MCHSSDVDGFCAIHDRALGISPVTSYLGVKRHLEGGGNAPDGGIEPHVEDFALEPLQRHGRAPLQIPGDAPLLQAPLEPRVCGRLTVGAPPSLQSHHASASRNLLIFSKRDPENSPEFSEFLYLCGNGCTMLCLPGNRTGSKRCWPSTSHHLINIFNRDPENSPEKSEFLYLYGNHWAGPEMTISAAIKLEQQATNTQKLSDVEKSQSVEEKPPSRPKPVIDYVPVSEVYVATMFGKSRRIVGVQTLQMDRTILNCSMYRGSIAHLW